MSIDYFSLPGEPKVDKSDWFASVTSLQGCFNGAHCVYSIELDKDTCLLQSDRTSKRKFVATCLADGLRYGYKIFASIQNALTIGGT